MYLNENLNSLPWPVGPEWSDLCLPFGFLRNSSLIAINYSHRALPRDPDPSGVASNIPSIERPSLTPIWHSNILLDHVTLFFFPKLNIMCWIFLGFVDFLNTCFSLLPEKMGGTCSLSPRHPESLEQMESTWQILVMCSDVDTLMRQQEMVIPAWKSEGASSLPTPTCWWIVLDGDTPWDASESSPHALVWGHSLQDLCSVWGEGGGLCLLGLSDFKAYCILSLFASESFPKTEVIFMFSPALECGISVFAWQLSCSGHCSEQGQDICSENLFKICDF